MGVEVIEHPVEEHVSTDDPDFEAHIANKYDVTKGYIEGTPLIALCGKRFVPSRDPSRYEKCPKCLQLFKDLVR